MIRSFLNKKQENSFLFYGDHIVALLVLFFCCFYAFSYAVVFDYAVAYTVV